MAEGVCVSVAMATYNGEKYIKEQLQSVLDNLGPLDEIVISDDGSKDSTRNIIEAFGDSRIRLIDGPKKGVKKNFENAIRACAGEFIFLCDQDDIWMQGKVEMVLKAFEATDSLVVAHDCRMVNDQGEILAESIYEFRNSGAGVLKNIIKNSYIGCCMAFRASMKPNILPIPDSIEMHDQWIGILGERLGRSTFIPDKLIDYRRHENNASDIFHHYGIVKMITNRVALIWNLFTRKKSLT